MVKYRKIVKSIGFVCVTSLVGLVCTEVVNASEAGRSENSFVIVGPAASPEYMGSDDYTVVPMIVSTFNIKDVEFEIEGLTARAAFLYWDGLKFGVTADLDMGRDEEVENRMIARMKEIDTAFNAGLFVSYDLSDQLLDGDNIEFKLAGFGDTTDTHNGAFATLGMTYTLPLYIPWRFEFEFETTYANTNYMDTYFGVDEIDSVASGLPRYKAGSSFRDVTLTANIAFFLSPQWGMFTRLSATRLIGDAADSPVVSTGDENQYFAGLGVIFRF